MKISEKAKLLLFDEMAVLIKRIRDDMIDELVEQETWNMMTSIIERAEKINEIDDSIIFTPEQSKKLLYDIFMEPEPKYENEKTGKARDDN